MRVPYARMYQLLIQQASCDAHSSIDHETVAMFIRLLFVVVFLGVFSENAILCSAIETQDQESLLNRENRKLKDGAENAEQKEIYWPINNPETKYQDLRTSSKKKGVDFSKDNQRRPKFFAPLSFLGGVAAGSLASTSAAANANVFGKLLNGAIALQFGSPPLNYLANLYDSRPLPYIPYPYPVFYSFRDLANANAANRSEQPKETEKKPNVEEVRAEQKEESNETVVSTTTERNLRKIVDAVAKDAEAIESSDHDKNDARPLLRADAQADTPNVTPNTTDSGNATETPSFDGYYSGHPQDIAHYVLATEHPPLAYFDDYIGSHYGVPAPEKSVPFASFHHTYPPYHESLSPYDSPIEFYNADRYVYETDSSRKFNGFKPMLR